MTRHLGDLGVAAPSEDITFGYFGAVLRANPGMSDVVLLELSEKLAGKGRQAEEDMPADEVLALYDAIVATFIHPDDATEFKRIARANGQGIAQVLDLTKRLVEATTEFPTSLPSGSSDGQPPTGSSSEGISSVLESLKGRPDLQLMVLEAS